MNRGPHKLTAVQLNIFILLFGGLQGLLLSFFLIRKKAYRGAYAYLAIYIGLMILQIALKVMSKVWLMDHMEPLYMLSYRFPLLYGPLAYLFAVHLLNPGTKYRLREVLHFIPFALSVTVLAIDAVTRQQHLLSYLFLNIRISTWVQVASVLFYHGMAWRAWKTGTVQAIWARNFIVLSLGVSLVITLAIYFMYWYYPALNSLKWVFVSLSLFIYWISFVALQQPDVFSVLRGGAAPVGEPGVEARLLVHRTRNRYHNSGLNKHEAGRIAQSLQNQVTVGKVFLDPDLDIEQLARMVSCTRHHLSQVLNETYGQSYYDFINHLRLAEAKKMLSNPSQMPVKIAAVAFDAGFSSISTFNEIFKKLTGMTPSQYRDQTIESGENKNLTAG